MRIYEWTWKEKIRNFGAGDADERKTIGDGMDLENMA
jgi:hypothetical protein